MRKLSLLLIALFWLVVPTKAQEFFDPVSWKLEVEHKQDQDYTILIKVDIDDGWHIYSQEEADIEFPPIPTEFVFNHSPETYELVGKTIEPNIEPMYDEVFEEYIVYFSNQVLFKQDIRVINPEGLQLQVEMGFSACDDEKCLPPDWKTLAISLDGGGSEEVSASLSEDDIAKTEALVLDLKNPNDYRSAEEEGSSKGLGTIFFLGFIGGFIALLTPCVFPMIPLTVSFFTNSADNRRKGMTNAIMYGLFIFLIYVLLSLPFHLMDSVDPEILNNISTNVTLNVLFFVIFLVFAFSFFGFYEITLPASWGAKMDSKATTVGGLIGVFFMALTLAIVSFSCTGPILGALLGGSLTSDGGAWQLTVGMSGFGLALALPFALFAMFPNWLNKLPKSGGWLNTVKVVLGFLELGFAFKFLSNADLVENWGFIKREVFIGIWILCSLGMALYLFGLIRFPHDGPKKKKLPKGNIIAGILSVAFTIYLLPGLTNTPAANLKLLSGFPPPLFYSVYDKGTDAPLGLEAYRDWDEGVAAAKASGKPIMLDFTGWACVNCRKMEELVWSRDDVFKQINEEFILISLYVDDRQNLSEEDGFNYMRPSGSVKRIKTIGDKWATFQTVNFRNNSQPYYVLMDSDLTLLNNPRGYTPDSDRFLEWLKEGVTNHKETR